MYAAASSGNTISGLVNVGEGRVTAAIVCTIDCILTESCGLAAMFPRGGPQPCSPESSAAQTASSLEARSKVKRRHDTPDHVARGKRK